MVSDLVRSAVICAVVGAALLAGLTAIYRWSRRASRLARSFRSRNTDVPRGAACARSAARFARALARSGRRLLRVILIGRKITLQAIE